MNPSVLVCGLAAIPLLLLPLAAQSTQRVSVTPTGQELAEGAVYTAISGDGRFVAFVSGAPNLVSGDTNGTSDVFVRELATGAVVRASITAAGVQANGASFQPQLSADGRFVAFSSWATNLATSNGNGTDADVFVKDLQTGLLDHVSVDSLGNGANDISLAPEMSADGRVVAYTSYATNLVANDTNGQPDAFVFDRQTRVCECVSVALGTALPVGGEAGSLSANGRFVAFQAGGQAVGLAAASTAIVRRDRVIGTVSAMNLQGGVLHNADNPLMSADAGTVLFDTPFALVPGDTDFGVDVYAVDVATGALTLVSVTPAGYPSSYFCTPRAITADGRWVLFSSGDPFDATDDNGVLDCMLADRDIGVIRRVSVGDQGQTGNGISATGSVSDDGRLVVFQSQASNLVPGDGNGTFDVFLRDTWPVATAQLYGAGFPGTGGVVPAFGMLGTPQIGSTPSLAVGGAGVGATMALVVLGAQEIAVATPWLGTLLASPDTLVPVVVPATGLVLPVSIPGNGGLGGVRVHLQVLLLDSGAAAGLSFTRGLRLLLGS